MYLVRIPSCVVLLCLLAGCGESPAEKDESSLENIKSNDEIDELVEDSQDYSLRNQAVAQMGQFQYNEAVQSYEQLLKLSRC